MGFQTQQSTDLNQVLIGQIAAPLESDSDEDEGAGQVRTKIFTAQADQSKLSRFARSKRRKLIWYFRLRNMMFVLVRNFLNTFFSFSFLP